VIPGGEIPFLSNHANQGSQSEGDERLGALVTNANAVAAIAAAVEGTLGPKGLDCMLVDRRGGVTITNDGSTILDNVDVTHPAARMLINAAKSQERQVGDGTTTTTLLAATLVREGVTQVGKGVPVAQVLEGLRAGVAAAVQALREAAIPISGFDDPLLRRAALISGRQDEELSSLALAAARTVGMAKCREAGFRLADLVMAREGAQSQVFEGLLLDKQRMNRQMPADVRRARILLVDDALEPEEVDDDALGTDAGFAKYMEYREQFAQALSHILEAGVNVVVAERAVGDTAEEALTEAGVMVLRRVSARDLARLAEYTGARPVKRAGIIRHPERLQGCLGRARRVYEDDTLEHIVVLGGAGKRTATLLVGAATAEVRAERRRIAQDAASAVQQAIAGGVVAGGGAAELGLIPQVEKVRQGMRAMAAFGVDCVLEALKRPLAQIVANAGYNPLGKVQEVLASSAGQPGRLGIDCETGEVADMVGLGVVDPATVKVCALQTAQEVAEAILRINVIIRKREEPETSPAPPT